MCEVPVCNIRRNGLENVHIADWSADVQLFLHEIWEIMIWNMLYS
jgi:hypothetical protein